MMDFSFPPISPFLELTQRAKQSPERIILHDHNSGISATASQLLHSVALLRVKVQAALSENGIDTKTPIGEQNSISLEKQTASDKDRFIFLIAPPGWEYVVSMLTIFSIGAAMSAQSIVIRPEEVLRFAKMSHPIALLYTPAFSEKIKATQALWAEQPNEVHSGIAVIEIQTAHPDSLAPETYTIDANATPRYDQPASLFFTSGTSGNPKGVVHSYRALLASADERIATWSLSESDVVLNQKPGNWMGGIFGILPSLIAGARLETCAAVFNPQWFWERIHRGDVTIFDIAPTGYDRLAQYYDENIANLFTAEKETYLQGMINVKVAGVSGSLLPPHTQKRWTELRRGKPLLNFYGSTEVTLICNMRWEDPDYLDMCSVGPAVQGVEVKLVDGEMRLKAPTMFSRYISSDPNQTAKAFDSEGFFITGDCAELIGNSYKLHGRANIDVLHFWGFTLHTGEIEAALYTLPYIRTAIVFPIPDAEYTERAAALLQLSSSSPSPPPSLEQLRKDLTEKTGLMLFKQPTVLYWLKKGEDIPMTGNGKVSKNEARERFFGEGWKEREGVEVLDLKGMEYWRMGGQC